MGPTFQVQVKKHFLRWWKTHTLCAFHVLFRLMACYTNYTILLSFGTPIIVLNEYGTLHLKKRAWVGQSIVLGFGPPLDHWVLLGPQSIASVTNLTKLSWTQVGLPVENQPKCQIKFTLGEIFVQMIGWGPGIKRFRTIPFWVAKRIKENNKNWNYDLEFYIVFILKPKLNIGWGWIPSGSPLTFSGGPWTSVGVNEMLMKRHET